MCERQALVEKELWVKQMLRARPEVLRVPQGAVGEAVYQPSHCIPNPPASSGHYINTELIEAKTRWVVFIRLNLRGF